MAFLLGVHALSFLAAWLNPLAIGLRLLLSALIALSLWRSLARTPEIAGLRLKSDGRWELQLDDGKREEACLLGSSLVNPVFVILHFHSGKKRRSLLICRDSLETEEFRRLRVALRVVGSGIQDGSSG